MTAFRTVLVAMLLATGAAAQVLWLKVEGPNRAFTAEMPGTPEYKIQDRLHSYSLTRGPIEYVIQTIEVDGQPRTVLQAALDGAASHLASGKWDRIDWGERQGAPSAEVQGTLKDRNVLRNLVMLRGKRLVSLGMRGPAGTTRFPDAEKFFASLRFAP